MQKLLFFYLLVFLPFSEVVSQNLVKDINTNSGSSAPFGTLVIGDKAFFIADDGNTGRELWVTDGTSNGTRLVKDIVAGDDWGYITNMTNLNGTLLFFLQNERDIGQGQLYKSDGTEAGTVPLASFNNLDAAYKTLAVGNTMYFYANNGLWKTNGTQAGTQLVKQIVTSPSFDFLLTEVMGKVYFVASTTQTGQELWQTDGTEAGTKIVKDILPGSSPSFPKELTAYNGKLYFIAYTPQLGNELWVSDGTDAGTTVVKDINPLGSLEGVKFIRYCKSLNLLFLAADDATNKGFELWKSDGTSNGTVFLADLVSGSSGSFDNSFIGFDFRNKFYFVISSTGFNRLLCSTDGTSTDTKIIHSVGVYSSESFAQNVVSIQEKSSFAINDSLLIYRLGDFTNTGAEPFVTNGASNGSRLLKDIFKGFRRGSIPTDFVKLGNSFLFSATTNGDGKELWKTDGTEAGTILLKNINLKSAGSDGFSFRNTINNQLIFYANTEASGFEVWRSDGTTNGTVLLKDIYPGIESSRPSPFFKFGNNLYFSATDSVSGNELWRTDGTTQNTVLVKNINNVFRDSDPIEFTALGNKFIFYATDTISGRELWISDGTDAGTTLLKDITVGRNNTNFRSNLVELNGSLYFLASTTASANNKLWKTNGTTTGTIAATVQDTFDIGSNILIAKVGNRIVFRAYAKGESQFELWGSDGQTTYRLNTVEPTFLISGVPLFVPLGANNLIFLGRKDNKIGLWKTDGTVQGTALIKDFTDNPIYGFTSFKNQVFFFSYTELWQTNGTEGGTSIVKKFPPFYKNEVFLTGLVSLNNKLYFRGADAETGSELWVSDGTEAGTKLFADIRKGKGSSMPNLFFVVNETLYFGANDGETGFELWRVLTTGIAEKVTTEGVTLFPNPASDILQFTLEKDIDVKEITVFDLTGKAIKSIKANDMMSTAINIQELLPAVYFIVFNSDKKTIVKQFVKAR
jgi:ELWxxDGT repeat protein